MAKSHPDQGVATASYSPTDKELTCDICGDVLSHPSHVSRHKRLKHSDELDHNCPTCGEVFSTDRGVKLHHKRSHGVSLAWDSTECEQCGETFEYINRNDPRFCDENCRDAYQIGENASNWRGGKVEIECEWCGKSCKVNPNKADSRRFCGSDCQGEWLSRRFEGEKSPMWNGGKLHYYGPNWKRQRRKARERDNHTCQDCGKHTSDLEKAIPVHHITPRRDFIDSNGDLDYESANHLDNLITLCPNCHHKWEGLYLRPDTRGEE